MIIVNTETGEIMDNCIVIDDQPKKAEIKSKPRGLMIEVECAAAGCSVVKEVRRVDYNRGWGRYCSKSCAAKSRKG